MPHCLIEGSRTLGQLIEPAELLCLLHDTAIASGLFKPGEVRVRLSLYPHYCVGGAQTDFIQLIFYSLAGRCDAQKKRLSSRVVRVLVERLPSVEAISLDVRDMRRTRAVAWSRLADGGCRCLGVGCLARIERRETPCS